VIGYESLGWYNSIDGIDWTLYAGTLGITYYPMGGGFFIKGGAGFSYGEAAFWNDQGFYTKFNEWGWSALGGTGFEYRFTPVFAMGFEANIVYAPLEDTEEQLKDLHYYGANITFMWYVPSWY